MHYRDRSFVYKKSKGLNLKVTPEEHALITEEAAKRGVNISEFVYDCIFTIIKGFKKKKAAK